MGHKLILYLDTCIYGRPFDRRPTPKTIAEAVAIKTIIKKCKTDGHVIIGSAAVVFELDDIGNDRRRTDAENFYFDTVDKDAAFSTASLARARKLEAAGLGAMDSRHLVVAENGNADFLLTVDIDFIRISTEKNLSKVKLMNPIDFMNGGYL